MAAEGHLLIKETFRRFDIQGSGLIDRSEIARILKVLKAYPLEGRKLEEKVDKLVENYKEDENGKVRYDEFVDWLARRGASKEVTAAKPRQSLAREWSKVLPREFSKGLPGKLVEHAPGTVLQGSDAWQSGRFLVMGGKAAVLGTGEDGLSEITLALLQKGNSFGWNSPEEAIAMLHRGDNCALLADMSTWEPLCTRIVVSEGEPLQLCSVKSLDMNDYVHTIGHGRLAELEGLSRQLADLWLHTSAPPVGLADQSSSVLRAHFMTALWGPLIDLLDEYDDDIRRRQKRGYRINDLFPLAGHQIIELRDHIIHLTEIWYGTARGGNVSLLLRWFMDAMEAMGVVAYSMKDIPQEKSPDGWATVVDGGARSSALKGKGGQEASHVGTGGMKQKQGKSAIDNTTLANVFTAKEARVLTVGRRLRKVLCKFLAIRQRFILRKLSAHLQMNLEHHAAEESGLRGHRLVKSILRTLTPEDFSTCGISVDSLSYRELKARGSVITGFGQLEHEDQKRMWDLVSDLLVPGCNPQDMGPKEDSEDVFDRLVLWCRNNPGEFFENDKMRHFEVMLAGLWCDKVVLVKRSAMERMTMARYFAVSWKRSQPLWAVFSTDEPTRLRESGTKEASRVRANECPYARKHGMSLPTGGFALDERAKCGSEKYIKKEPCKLKLSDVTKGGYSLMMEMQWVNDPKANVENWFLTDIEKIVNEASWMNPHGSKSMMLPREMFVNVGQNPKIGSSIKKTQHTQLCEGSLSSYPVLRVSSSGGPRRSQVLGADVDFVDIGPAGTPVENCGFFVKILTARPADPAVVEFLIELRLRLLSAFGGAEKLDFFCTALSDECGGFVTLFAPIPQLEKVGDAPPDLASWLNPITGETTEALGLEEGRIDFGKGVGHFLVAKPSLKAQLLENGEDFMRRLWAFNRTPGIREYIHKFADEVRIFE